jgi:multiple sugar transport system permease protein
VRGRTRLSFTRRRRLFLVMLGGPALAYVVVVALGPLAQGVRYSFYDFSLLHPAQMRFVGLDNYAAVFSDPSARRALLNTFAFTLTAVAAEFALGLSLALLLWRDSRFNRAALALLLVPVTVTPLAVGLIFRALLTPDFGLIGYWAVQLGVSGPRGFLADPVTALPALVGIDVWEWTPLMALILLAGLKTLPGEVLEAAAVDGAGPLARLWRIVLPLLAPTISLAVLLRGMDAFKVFDSVFVTTKGGPGDATNVLMFYAAKQGLEFFDIGAASAVSNVMLVCVGVLAAAFILLVRRADARAVG